jgi:hypothetical protein
VVISSLTTNKLNYPVFYQIALGGPSILIRNSHDDQCASIFSTQIVIPTLQMLDQKAGIPYTDITYYLVMGTIANESLLGTWLVQEGGRRLG